MADIRASTEIDGVFGVDPVVHVDGRGTFVETWRREWIPGCREMLQANRAERSAGALAGRGFAIRLGCSRGPEAGGARRAAGRCAQGRSRVARLRARSVSASRCGEAGSARRERLPRRFGAAPAVAAASLRGDRMNWDVAYWSRPEVPPARSCKRCCHGSGHHRSGCRQKKLRLLASR